MNLSRTGLLLLALLVSGPAFAGATVTGKPKVDFYAVGNPGFLDIDGVTNVVQLVDDGTTLTFSVPMKTVDTGIALRDTHMNDHYVEIAKYPDAILAVRRADVKWPVNLGETAQGTLTADFNIHGVSKPVTVTYEVRKSKTGFRIHGKFPFDSTEHGIAIPSYLGITVDPKMKAEATVDITDAPAP